MESVKREDEAGQLYRKPVLRIIELTAEEVLGVGCKATGLPSIISGPTCPLDTCVNIVGTS